MHTLRSVEELIITFLVDNSIEWFTPLPAGFTHELPRHIRDCPVDETTGVPTMDFNKCCCGAHGFSALIQTRTGDQSFYTLFDTGPDATSLVRNISAMRIPVQDIGRVVISHWHSDHTGGLLSFLAHREKDASREIVVDIHPDRPLARGIAPGPHYDKVVAALPRDPTLEDIERNAKVEANRQGHAVASDTVWVSGEIPRTTDFEPGILGGMRWRETGGKYSWMPERDIMDERYVAVDVLGKGLVIFSACSHAGIVNVVKDAVNTFQRPVYMIIGGLHLAPPDFASAIEPTVTFLANQLKPSPTFILPMHCTGFRAKVALEAALGDACVPAGVGIRVRVTGNREDDERLFPATY